MIEATRNDKSLVVDILCKSFDKNGSVNYVVKQDKKRKERIRKLMEYSFDVCQLFGQVYLSENKQACALTLLPENKKITVKSVLLDLKLVFFCIGIERVKKVMRRDSKIKKFYPSNAVFYLWFIGVMPENQQKGIGSKLLDGIIKESHTLKKPIYLETSMSENLQFYNKRGFEVYQELDFGHKLFLVRKNNIN